MTQDERNEILQESRIFALAAPTLLALIAKKRDYALGQLMSDFRQGKTDNTARVAELTCLGDLEREIKQKEAIFETLSKPEKRK